MASYEKPFEWYPDKDYPEFMHIKPLQTQLDTQPTLIIAESLFLLTSLSTLLHASLTSRRHVLVWIAAIISGTANDVFFMFLPMVDNFWHAQATVMITPRLPLYIPLAYASFQYIGERSDVQRRHRHFPLRGSLSLSRRCRFLVAVAFSSLIPL